jgi:hypothetical protein
MNDLYFKSLGNASHNIYHFPNELWITIFSYLPVVYIVKMRFICRLFHYLVSNPQYVAMVLDVPKELQKRRRIKKYDRFSKIVTKQQLEFYHSLLFHSVDISNPECDGLFPRGYSDRCIFNQIFYFKELNMYYPPVYHHIHHYYRNKRLYNGFDLEKREYYSISSIELYNFIKEFGKQIQHLKLNNCDAVTDMVILAICEECVQLKTLEARYCLITTDSLNAVLSSNAMKNTLKVLDFSGCPALHDFHQSNNKDLFRGFKNLSSLCFKMCQYGGGFTGTDNDFLNKLITTAEEEIEQARIESLKHYGKQQLKLVSNPAKIYNFYHTLKRISLDQWNSWNANTMSITLLTHIFPNLEHIELVITSHQLPSSKALTSHHNAAKYNTTLKYLSISGNLEGMMDMFWELYPALVTFIVSRCQISPTITERHMETFFKCHKQLQYLSFEIENVPLFSSDISPTLKVLRATISDADSATVFIRRYGYQFEVLDLQFYLQGFKTGQVLNCIRDHCSNLVELQISNQNRVASFPTVQDCFLYQIGKYMPKLSVLHINHFRTDEEFTRICSMADYSENVSTQLEVLHLSNSDTAFLNLFKGNILVNIRNLYINTKDDKNIVHGLIVPDNAHRIEVINIASYLEDCSIIKEYSSAIHTVRNTSLRSFSISGSRCGESTEDIKQIVTKAGINLHSLNINVRHDANIYLNELIQSCPLLMYGFIRSGTINGNTLQTLETSLEILKAKTMKSLTPYRNMIYTFDRDCDDLFNNIIPHYRLDN